VEAVADGAAGEAVAVVAEDLVAAEVRCAAAAGSRLRRVLAPLRARRRGQVLAARDPVVAKSLDPDEVRALGQAVARRAALGPAAGQSLARDPAVRPRERGPALLVVESVKAALGPVVDCQALAPERD
jgi:hypothetical protein